MNTLLQGRYEIVQELSVGGFSKTWLALDTHKPSKPKCVVKQFKPPQAADSASLQHAIQRFEKEAAVLEKLGQDCPQIPRLHAHFVEQGEYYLVQQFIEGPTLRQYVQQKGLQDEAILRHLLNQLLPVLEFVHAHGVIHRDIKPDNIILRESDHLPFLIDFGAVRESVAAASATPSQAPYLSIPLGTPGFMPIEQLGGTPVFASDLYSLAMTVLYAATGKEPQEHLDLQSGSVKWEALGVRLSRDFVEVLRTAGQQDFRLRYPNASAMRQAIAQLSAPTIQMNGVTQEPYVTPPPYTTHANGQFATGQPINVATGPAAVPNVNKSRRKFWLWGIVLVVIGGFVMLVGLMALGWLMESFNETQIAEKLAQMETLRLHGQWDEVIKLADEVIELDALRAEAYINRGRAWNRRYQLDKAKADYAHAVDLLQKANQVDGSQAHLHQLLGRAYLLQDKNDDAITEASVALSLSNGRNAKALVVRANAYKQKAQAEKNEPQKMALIDKVEKDYQAALEIDKGNLWALRGLAICILDRGLAVQDKLQRTDYYQKAIQLYTLVLQRDAKFQVVYDDRGLSYENLGYIAENEAQKDEYYERALEDYGKAIELNQKDAWAMARRGWIYQAQGKTQRAIAEYEQALSLDPSEEWVKKELEQLKQPK